MNNLSSKLKIAEREFESRLYEQLKEQIARDFDMQVTVARTEVGGICNDCLSHEKKSPNH